MPALQKMRIKNIILPLGDFTKVQVYELAAELNLSGIHSPESQDICFLAGKTVSTFFAQQGIADNPGDIVNTGGKVIGEHLGLWHYTTGQRKGLGLPDATPWYVQRLDAGHNRLVVCKKDSLYTRKIIVRDVSWSGRAEIFPWQGKVQIRGRHKAAAATIVPGNNGEFFVTFATRQRAATPGQFAAFYCDDCVVGSGVITGQEVPEETEP
jgi:tRNA-specific 2-thiouridylase